MSLRAARREPPARADCRCSGPCRGPEVLWIDGTADSYFGPELSQALYSSFAGSGGRATFAQPGGSGVWGPLVESHLAQRRVAP